MTRPSTVKIATSYQTGNTQTKRRPKVFQSQSFVNLEQRNKYRELLANILQENDGQQITPKIGHLLENMFKRTYSAKSPSDTLPRQVVNSFSRLCNNSIGNVKATRQSTTHWLEDDENEEIGENSINHFFPKSSAIIKKDLNKYSSTAMSKSTDDKYHHNDRGHDDKSLQNNDRNMIRKKYDQLCREISQMREEMYAQCIAKVIERIQTILPRPPSPQRLAESSISETIHESSESDDDNNVFSRANDWKFSVLSDIEEHQINYILGEKNLNSVLVDAFNIKITYRDIHTLKPTRWLNDQVINFYMQLILKRNNEKDSLPKTYAFSTFFYPRLLKDGYDIILIPLHLGMHWALITIHVPDRQIRYYDSMVGSSRRCLDVIICYLSEEHLKRKGFPLNTYSWAKMKVNCAQQLNADDCGVFACQFAEAKNDPRNCRV
ncbi:hypothetical protein GJ496_007947 [Pomphorhynchus laevis]|nr:hypothetical protein GJ496_007947 [Pomphorhynchus laevis]